jgi:hypothetical protein
VACLIQIGECFVSVTNLFLTFALDPFRKPSTGPLAPQPPGDLPPDQPPVPPPEPRQGAWRSVHQRGGFRRTRKKSEGPPAGPVIETTPPAAPPPDRAQTTGSWATWQGKYN